MPGSAQRFRERRASGASRRRAGLAAFALLGAAVYGYLLTEANLPEEWGYWLVGGAVLGLAIGRWYMVLGALTTLVLPIEGSNVGVGEVVTLTLFVYLPGAALAIAVGVGVRTAIDKVILARLST